MKSAESHPTPTPARTRAVLLALLGATLLKILWAWNSVGSVDAVLFFNFARGIEEHGLSPLYGMDEKFNHTPLTGGFAVLLYRAAGGVPAVPPQAHAVRSESDMQERSAVLLRFAFLLRLASILADIAVVAGLLRWRAQLGNRPEWWALILFAASPVSLMISGFHGNVDPVMVAALFFATVAAACGRPVLCGLLFGLAANVKIVPIVLAPVFFFFWLARSGAWRFVLASGAVMLAGWSLPLLVCPKDFLHNVFGYGSTWGVWGLPYLLRLTGWEEVQKIGFKSLTPTQNMIAAGLKFAAIGGIATVGWLRRQAAPAEFAATVGLAWLVFFICAPGVGVQYMVWAAPFLLLLTARGYAAITAAATVFLFVYYHSTSPGSWPWFLVIPRGPETPLWSAWGTLAWLSFVGVFFALVWRRRLAAGSQVAALPAVA
jgi:hypothetical protein